MPAVTDLNAEQQTAPASPAGTPYKGKLVDNKIATTH